MIICRSPGKAIILGEYALLQGAPGLVVAVDRYVECRITPASRFELEALGSRYEAKTAEALRSCDPRLTVVAAVFDALIPEPELPSLKVSIDSSTFSQGGAKLGLGSSAAVAVSLAHALRILRGCVATPAALFTDALRAHRSAQGGLGSGIDIAASAYGGVLAYRQPKAKSDHPEQLDSLQWPRELGIDIFWSGASTSTSEMIQSIQRLSERDPDSAATRMTELASIAERGVSAFSAHDIKAFLEHVSNYGASLERLGDAAGVDIVGESHRRIGSVASARGAVYKPSGAGAGDIGIALYPRPEGAPHPDRLALNLDHRGSHAGSDEGSNEADS